MTEERSPVLFLGDSITAQGSWDTWLPDEHTLNQGVSGDTTDGVLARLEAVVAEQPEVIVLLIGTNDFGNHRASAEHVVRNVETILVTLRRELPGVRLLHIGAALDPALGDLARATAAATPAYRWLGALPHMATRRRLRHCHAMVIASRMEGGANVIIEAVTSGVPVLASHIEGNVGMLGADYAGYFPPGDAAALARLVDRCGAHGRHRRDVLRFCRLDRLGDPEGTRAVFRPRDVPGGDAAAYVKAGLRRGEQELRLTVTVHAPRAHVERRIGPWARIVEDGPDRCRLEIEASDPHWAAFGLAHLDAPVTVEEAPPVVLDTLRTWSDRLGAMLPSR